MIHFEMIIFMTIVLSVVTNNLILRIPVYVLKFLQTNNLKCDDIFSSLCFMVRQVVTPTTNANNDTKSLILSDALIFV